MKLLAVIKLAHQTIAQHLGFFLVNALILAGMLAIAAVLFYFSLASGFTLVISLLYPLLALLFYMYVADAQKQFYGPRLRGEEPFPTPQESCSKAKKNWPLLAGMAVILVALAFCLLQIPLLTSALYSKINPLRTKTIPSFEQLKNIPLAQLAQPANLIYLIYYLLTFLLVFLCLPLFALGFTAVYQKEEGFKAAIKKIRFYFKAKPCSSTLLYLFSLVIIILFPNRILHLKGPQSLPVVDIIFLGLQLLIALLVLVYGLLMALVSQMVLQALALQEKKPA